MPGANESSTVEWQSAHWMPIDRSPPLRVRMRRHADDGVGFEQRQRDRGIVQVDPPAAGSPAACRRQRLGIDLQPDRRAPRPG